VEEVLISEAVEAEKETMWKCPDCKKLNDLQNACGRCYRKIHYFEGVRQIDITEMLVEMTKREEKYKKIRYA
jgi:hypothetical protein